MAQMRLNKIIATVVCGGEIETGSLVEEAWLLGLERKYFVELLNHPKLSATVFERAPVDGITRKMIAKRGFQDRVDVKAGDMFNHLPLSQDGVALQTLGRREGGHVHAACA